MDIFGGLGLVVAIICAIVTYNMAAARGRTPILWGILGFFFPIIAIIVLLVIGHG